MVFVALYPDLSGLWLPSKIIGVYYAPLPTWLYGFQFSVNQQISASVGSIGIYGLSSALLALFVAAIAAWVAWERRIVVGWRRSRLVLGAGDGDGDGADLRSGAPGAPGEAAEAALDEDSQD
jgi:hypothetical protein